MLNLDLIDGLALDKGCYTGQEIIARAHYRGHVKRRMQRFISVAPCSLTPGQTGTFSDGRGFKVVEAVPVADGHCEFLAVANPTSGPNVGAAQSDDTTAAATATPIITARQLDLPYPLPLVRA